MQNFDLLLGLWKSASQSNIGALLLLSVEKHISASYFTASGPHIQSYNEPWDDKNVSFFLTTYTEMEKKQMLTGF